MVLIKLRDSETIKEVSVNDANDLIRKHKATLFKNSSFVKVILLKEYNDLARISEIEYNLAERLEKDSICKIIEWSTDAEIKELQKSIKKEIKKEITN